MRTPTPARLTARLALTFDPIRDDVGGTGRFLHVSDGVEIVYDITATPQAFADDGSISQEGERLLSLTINGEPIVADGEVVPGAALTMTIVDFLANGGDQTIGSHLSQDYGFTRLGLSDQNGPGELRHFAFRRRRHVRYRQRCPLRQRSRRTHHGSARTHRNPTLPWWNHRPPGCATPTLVAPSHLKCIERARNCVPFFIELADDLLRGEPQRVVRLKSFDSGYRSRCLIGL